MPTSRFRVLTSLFLFFAVLPTLPAQEVQHHGLVFEAWAGDAFFDGYRLEDYTQKWDFPAEVNRRHGGIPVNPKAIRWGRPIDMGDALRQFSIEEPFILLVGFWEQHGDHKHFVKLVAPRVEPDLWRALWAPVTRADLEALDALIKDRSLDYLEARRLALEMKNQPPFTEAVIQVNPKIDAHGQRRLQCSIRFRDFFGHLAPGVDPEPEASPTLWGQPGPAPILSPPRRFGDSEEDDEADDDEPEAEAASASEEAA